ncbi:hypothetical protein PlfCFBP13513_11870 [Plantibacter flavus]|nr:hypothetical protein PlfCFBP13513_11870 [Plantibacter flavus]
MWRLTPWRAPRRRRRRRPRRRPRARRRPRPRRPPSPRTSMSSTCRASGSDSSRLVQPRWRPA